jgi:hypothetical protein
VKYFEVSKKIQLDSDVSVRDIKDFLLKSFERPLKVDQIGDGDNRFAVSGTTGQLNSKVRHTRVNMNVEIKKENGAARIIISGYTKPAKSLAILYWIMFFIVLLVGLLPGSIETSGDNSDSLDVLVMLIFSIFIVFDLNKKMKEPQGFIGSILDSAETYFG